METKTSPIPITRQEFLEERSSEQAAIARRMWRELKELRERFSAL